MSNQKLKELKLYQKLERDLTYRQKLQSKIKQISCHMPSIKQHSVPTTKLNNNKKQLIAEEKNAEIQRQNRILFQKLQSQATKSYYQVPPKKNRTFKKLNQIQNSESYSKNSRKYQNFSQSKIHSRQQQSRISFQESQQMMRLKQKQNKKKTKMITELSPEIIQLLRSRMIESRTVEKEQKETVLFQGVGEIDEIKFKVKICVRNRTYFLTGRNKHTEIMLKMQLAEYKKFHRQILRGNPSNIFQYLKIDKGQIRFKTRQQEIEKQTQHYENKRKIYKIVEEQHDGDIDIRNGPKVFQRIKMNQIKQTKHNEDCLHSQQHTEEEEQTKKKQNRVRTKTIQKSINQIYDEEELENDIIEKITSHNKKNNSRSTENTPQKGKPAKRQQQFNPEEKIKRRKNYKFDFLQI